MSSVPLEWVHQRDKLEAFLDKQCSRREADLTSGWSQSRSRGNPSVYPSRIMIVFLGGVVYSAMLTLFFFLFVAKKLGILENL